MAAGHETCELCGRRCHRNLSNRLSMEIEGMRKDYVVNLEIEAIVYGTLVDTACMGDLCKSCTKRAIRELLKNI